MNNYRNNATVCIPLEEVFEQYCEDIEWAHKTFGQYVDFISHWYRIQ